MLSMLKKSFVAIMLLCSVVNYANAFSSGFGPSEYGSGTQSSINNKGPLALNGTTVTGEVNVMGPLYANNADIGYFDIKGVAYFTDSIVRNDSIIMGYLSADKTTFEGNIVAYTDNMELANVVANNLFFRKSESVGAAGKLMLRNTVVQGDITFDSVYSLATIYLCEGSSIEGHVTGANVTENDCALWEANRE